MIFVAFLKWTDQGARNPKDSIKRNQGAKSIAEKLGGKLISSYVLSGGDHNVVAITDMPNGEAMAKLAAAIMATGNAHVSVMRGFTPEEFATFASDVPTP